MSTLLFILTITLFSSISLYAEVDIDLKNATLTLTDEENGRSLSVRPDIPYGTLTDQLFPLAERLNYSFPSLDDLPSHFDMNLSDHEASEIRSKWKSKDENVMKFMEAMQVPAIVAPSINQHARSLHSLNAATLFKITQKAEDLSRAKEMLFHFKAIDYTFPDDKDSCGNSSKTSTPSIPAWIEAFVKTNIKDVSDKIKGSSIVSAAGYDGLLTFEKTLQNYCSGYNLIAPYLSENENIEIRKRFLTTLRFLYEVSPYNPPNNHVTRLGGVMGTCTLALSVNHPNSQKQKNSLEKSLLQKYWIRAHDLIQIGMGQLREDGVNFEGPTYADYTDEILLPFIRQQMNIFGSANITKTKNFQNYMRYMSHIYSKSDGYVSMQDSRTSNAVNLPLLLDPRIPQSGLIKYKFSPITVNSVPAGQIADFFVFADITNKVIPEQSLEKNFYASKSGITVLNEGEVRLFINGARQNSSHAHLSGTGDFRVSVDGVESSKVGNYAPASVKTLSNTNYTSPKSGNGFSCRGEPLAYSEYSNVEATERTGINHVGVLAKGASVSMARYFSNIGSGDSSYTVVFDYANGKDDKQVLDCEFRYHGQKYNPKSGFLLNNGKSVKFTPLFTSHETVELGRDSPNHNYEHHHEVLVRKVHGTNVVNATLITSNDKLSVTKIHTPNMTVNSITNTTNGKVDVVALSKSGEINLPEYGIIQKGKGLLLIDSKSTRGPLQMNLYDTESFSMKGFSLNSSSPLDVVIDNKPSTSDASYQLEVKKNSVLNLTTENLKGKKLYVDGRLYQFDSSKPTVSINLMEGTHYISTTKSTMVTASEREKEGIQNYNVSVKNKSYLSYLHSLNDEDFAEELRKMRTDSQLRNRARAEGAGEVLKFMRERFLKMSGGKIAGKDIDLALGVVYQFSSSNDYPVAVDFSQKIAENTNFKTGATISKTNQFMASGYGELSGPNYYFIVKESRPTPSSETKNLSSPVNYVDPGTLREYSGQYILPDGSVFGGQYTNFSVRTEMDKFIQMKSYGARISREGNFIDTQWIESPNDKQLNIALNYVQNFINFSYNTMSEEHLISAENKYFKLIDQSVNAQEGGTVEDHGASANLSLAPNTSLQVSANAQSLNTTSTNEETKSHYKGTIGGSYNNVSLQLSHMQNYSEDLVSTTQRNLVSKNEISATYNYSQGSISTSLGLADKQVMMDTEIKHDYSLLFINVSKEEDQALALRELTYGVSKKMSDVTIRTSLSYLSPKDSDSVFESRFSLFSERANAYGALGIDLAKLYPRIRAGLEVPIP